MSGKLDKAVRYILRSYPNHEVENFIDYIWHPLVEQRVANITGGNFKGIVSKLSFLLITDGDEVKFREFLTSDLPREPYDSSMEALKLLGKGVKTKAKLGEMLSNSDDPKTYLSRGSNLYATLKLFNLIQDNFEFTNIDSYYFNNRNISIIQSEMLNIPIMNTYYNIIRELEGIGSSEEIRKLIGDITLVIIRNSRGNNLIRDSVARKRISNLISWFRNTNLIDDDLKVQKEDDKSSVLLLKKEIDWSVFEDGLTVPIDYHQIFYEANGEVLTNGDIRNGKFIFANTTFEITFKNFKRLGVKSDTVHIRYDGNHLLRNELIKRFSYSYKYITRERGKKKSSAQKNPIIKIPNKMKEYLYIYSTDKPYEYQIEFLTFNNNRELKNLFRRSTKDKWDYLEDIYNMSEKEFNSYLAENYRDNEAKIVLKEGLITRRSIRNNLVETLKKKYNNCCQICKHSFKDEFGVDYSEAHHIKYFAKHEDHSPQNIVILCPNHHRIIHKTDATFLRDQKAFRYPNGHVEVLKLNDHIK